MMLLVLLAYAFYITAAVALPAGMQPGAIIDDPHLVDRKCFDYIIVGGGTAGLPLAARLTEDPHKTVLVLEAGPAHLNDPLILTPAEVGAVYGNPDYDWVHKTVPQPHADNVIFNFTRGRVLGGSSALNAMIWDRPSKPDFDMLAKLGNPGWDWDHFLPFLKKPENFTQPDPSFAALWNQSFQLSTRGSSGQIRTTFTSALPEAEMHVEPAALHLGLKRVMDPMAGATTGTWRSTSSVEPATGTRSYSVTGYLLPFMSRPNLRVLAGAHVSRINWNRPSSFLNFLSPGAVKAEGVSFICNGTLYSVRATREVILSAGVIGSPQLLELSGIGGHKRLRKLGVPTVVDLATVGENMQDHIFTVLSYRTKPGVETLDRLFFNQTFAQQQAARFLTNPPSSVFTYTSSSMTFLDLPSFIPSFTSQLASLHKQISSTSRTPGQILQQNHQIDLLQSGSSMVGIISEALHISPDVAQPGTGYVSFLVMLEQPFSRGSTHIGSSNALDHPAIDPNYLNVDFDLDVLTSAAQFVRSNLTKTPAWAAVLDEEQFPGPSVKTTDQLKDSIRRTFSSQGHTTGTSSMLPRASGGVVDCYLKVYGTRNVRVVDLSVMPQLFTGHPQSLVYAIAEKAADIIKSGK